MKPKWIVYSRSGDAYPVALDTALDWNHLKATCALRLMPGPWETIRCSSGVTAQQIADRLNDRWEDKE